MPRAGPSRRLATILFLDVVDSTRIAAELGDERWKGLLGRFRGVVRAELKRHGGHEEDTAGDGFFATFAQPARAVRAAVSIVRAVQALGVDVRCGPAGTTALWLLDPEASTLTPIDAKSGAAGQPIGIGANLRTAVVGFGSVWVAAGDKVLRVEGNGPTVTARIAMPTGFSAGSIAVDPQTSSLWVADCGCPIQ